jgi:hypothetical protein
MALPKGYHYVPGSGRRFVTGPSGSQITRQSAENIFAQNYGFTNIRALDRARKSEGFLAYQGRPTYADSWQEAKAAGTSKAEFNAAMARYYADPAFNQTDNSPNGAKAQMLQAMGRRAPGAEYNVGESPTPV